MVAGFVYEVLSCSEVAGFAYRIICHADRLVLRAEGIWQNLDIVTVAQVATQYVEYGRHRLYGIDLSGATCQSRNRTGVIAQIGADVDAMIAIVHQLHEVIDILRSRCITTDAEPLTEEKEPAYNPQVTIERKQSVEEFME